MDFEKKIKNNSNSKHIFFAFSSFVIIFLFFIDLVFAGSWTTNTQSAFNEATYNNTEFDTDSVKLRDWSDSEKELPDNGITDQWGIDMTGNVLLMHMNEGTGAIVDSSGNGNDGTYNAVLYSQGGKLNTSIGFDGDNDSINVGNDSSLDLEANMTISTWLKPSALVNDGVIMGKPHTAQANPYITYALGYSSNGRNYGLALGNGTAQRGCYTDSNTVVLNDWTHFTATFNGTQIDLYIDGQLNKSCSFSYFEINQNTANVLLGDYPYFDDSFDYAGEMDELAIFNRRLSAQEIESIYSRQANKYGGNNPGDYVSKTLDALSNTKWENISWVTEIPYGQELPDNQVIEAGDFFRGMSMTGNVGLWHMDEASGSIIDNSGNGNNGTANGGVSYNVDGKFGTALEFNGTDGYVQIPNHVSINPTSEITLLAWIKWNIDPALGSGYASIINKNVDNQYRLHHNSSNTSFEFAIRTTPNGNRWVDSTTLPQQGKWYFVAGTYDGTVLRMYVNGVLENINNHAGTLVTSANDLNIGRRSSNDRYFDGIIDEIAIFGRALSAQEIEDIYKRGTLNLGLSVRSCDDSSCSGESWVALGDNLASPQNLTIVDNQFLQYKFDFETQDANFSSQLYEVEVEYNASPNSPTNETPINLLNNVGLNPNLTASAFFDPENDNHMVTEWRVDNDSDFSSPVWIRTSGIGEAQTAITNINGFFTNELSGEAGLNYETNYYWQVRYKDDGSNNWSNWSTNTSFTTLNLYTITYESNGADTGFSPGNQTKAHEIDLVLRANVGSLSKTGYDFTGWNTSANGSGTHYAEGATFSINAATALFAEWTLGVCPIIPNVSTYTQYPACGPATCAQGYILKDGQCVAGGGGGLPPQAYTTPKSSTIQPLVALNGGADKTKSRIVEVELQNYKFLVPKANRYSISDNENFDGASIRRLSGYEEDGLKWDLCPRKKECLDKTYDVYVKFYNQWGRASEIIKSSIFLKSEAGSEDFVKELIIEENKVVCEIPEYLREPIIYGFSNNSKNVMLLEQYLNIYEGYNLPIDGFYSLEDKNAVIEWQERNSQDILAQWGLSKGTGNIFTTSLAKIKQMVLENPCKTGTEQVDVETYFFSRDLSIGMTGEDVKLLQEYLNNQGFKLADSGPGSPGSETTKFGALTRAALIRFQNTHKINPAVGYFGSITRKVINNHK